MDELAMDHGFDEMDVSYQSHHGYEDAGEESISANRRVVTMTLQAFNLCSK